MDAKVKPTWKYSRRPQKLGGTFRHFPYQFSRKPDDEFEDDTLPGWDVPITQYFCLPGDEASYNYDFGDSWDHRIVLEGMYLQKSGVKYPHCIDGERACPPEDCGGIPGYYNLLEIISDPEHEEHEDMISWLSTHAKNYHPYNAEYFEAGKVKFSNPKKRWKMAFQNE